MVTNGAEVLLKTISGLCQNLCATNLPLYRSTFPLLLSLFWRIILVEMSVLGVLGIFFKQNSKVLLALSKVNSEEIADLYASDSANSIAFTIDPGPALTIIA